MIILLFFSLIRMKLFAFIKPFHSICFQGHVEQWIDFATLEIDVHIGALAGPRYGYRAYHAAVS